MRPLLPRAGITAPVLAGAAVVIWAWLGASVPIRASTVTFRTVRNATAPAVDLRERLHTARVRLGDRDCSRWTGIRWLCGPSPWHFVGRYRGRATTDRGVQDRACIWAHPWTRGRGPVQLSIAFPDVPIGSQLRGEAAILDSPRTGDTVEVKVLVDGKQRGRFRATDDRGRRWRPWRVDTKRDAGRRAVVELRVSARDASWRHLCFTGFAE